VLAALGGAPEIPPDVLAAIDSVLPADPPVELRGGAAEISRRLAAEVPASATDPRRQGRLHQKLGWRLADAGHPVQARWALQEAASMARRRAANGGEPYPDDLALALRGLGAVLLDLGEWGAARAALAEAVQLWTALPGSAGAAETAAECLDLLGVALDREGRTAEASTARRRAVALWRGLTSTDGGCLPGLVRSLVGDAEQLRGDGRHLDALGRLDEAIECWGELARRVDGDRAVDGDPDFAATLLARGLTLCALRRTAEAAAALSGAVAVFRRLASLNVAFDADLARALAAQADAAGDAGDWPGAAAAYDDATAIHHRLVRIDPDRYEHDLARCLIGSARLRLRGNLPDLHDEDALAAVLQAVTILRRRSGQERRADDLEEAQRLAADLLDAAGRINDAQKLREHAGLAS
jgi:tetratricopeptide (TPR) repeat protein